MAFMALNVSRAPESILHWMTMSGTTSAVCSLPKSCHVQKGRCRSPASAYNSSQMRSTVRGPRVCRR